MSEAMNRRGFLKVLGATGGGAVALSACSSDTAEKLIPYLVPPEGQIPGIATWYASTCRECASGCGVHVRVREGRAVKVEGNPASPVNRGKLCSRGQASLQGLYNPDRVRGPLRRNASGGFDPITWDEALAQLSQQVGGAGANGVRFLTGHESGSFDALVDEWLAAVGSPAGRSVWETFSYEALRAGNELVFGTREIPYYDFAESGYVLSFGADFLETWLNPTGQALDFANMHGFRDGRMGKYVHIESRMGMTAFSADEWLAARHGSEAVVALAMANVVLSEGLGTPRPDAARLRPAVEQYTPEVAAEASGLEADTIRRIAREFAAQPGLALAGGIGSQHETAHLLAAAVNVLNYACGNVGRTIHFGREAPGADRSSYRALTALRDELAAGQVRVLMVHGTNPVHTAAGSGFDQAMAQAGFRVSFARVLDETAALCDLVLPDHDPLEQWNDFLPHQGAWALLQPTMAPVFDSRQTGDVLLQAARALGGSVAARFPQADFKSYVQARWQQLQRQLRDNRPFDTFWRESLQNGGVFTEPPRRNQNLAASVRVDPPAAGGPETGRWALMAYPAMTFYDGRAANRPWIQELPDPLTKTTWSSWVEMSPHTAEQHDLHEGELVEVTSAAGSVTAPVFIYPGMTDDVVAIPIGQGHTGFGRYATGVGVNVLGLLDGAAQAHGGRSHTASVTLRKTGGYERLFKTSGQNRQMGRGIAQAATIGQMTGTEEFHPYHAAHAAPVPEHIEPILDQWQQEQWADHERGRNYAGEHPRWGMAIDLSRCTGCSACITACYAENNIPVVGTGGILKGREMTWIRIERYFEGGEHGEPFEVRVLPMMCQQCGNAPCEPVCPVFAAYHTPDGLNGQVYNRCVGTRYCGNNCPYKVRYFNYLDYQNPADPTFAFPEPLHWQLNPDVTVRSKGVMEKCTFCVQRIRGKQHEARLQNRQLRDGEIRTACQQTCPTEAITFGDLNDPASRVSQLAADEQRGYHVLEGLNTYPAVTYLMKVRNTTASHAPASEAH